MRLNALPSNYKTYICEHVFAVERPILYVDPWLPGGRGVLMHCGSHQKVTNEFVVVGLGHLLERDASLLELGEFPDNHYATREDENAPWLFTDE